MASELERSEKRATKTRASGKTAGCLGESRPWARRRSQARARKGVWSMVERMRMGTASEEERVSRVDQ